ncbi:MAG: hypothetical protein HQ469_01335 [Cyanobacteria bacterium]|nr:hypothetical protein [Cyanobacteria bacterium bin.275]
MRIELIFPSSQPRGGAVAAVAAADLLCRSPQRISATLLWYVLQRLQQQADFDGRTLSNLIAHLLEKAMI